METALRRIADMLEAFIDAVAAWFATGAWRPEAWPGITWVLVAALLVLSWLLAWRRRAPRTLDVRSPQLLVTSGEVVPDGSEDAGLRPSGRRRRRAVPVAHAAAGTYAMTVSNLSRYPVQLLEIALRDGRRGAPRVADVDAVVPAMGSVSVSGRILLGLRGDGWLDLYCYAAAPRFKVHRHRVELVWEPWAARFKAAPLEQVSAPARRLASDEPDARFLEDDVPEATAPMAVAVDFPPRSAAPREGAPPVAVVPAPSADRLPATVPEPAAAPERTGRAVAAVEPPAPPAPAPGPAVPAAAPVAPPAGAPSAGARPEVADATPRSTARPASAGPEPRGVPRIATPAVGVAVTGRGGAAARTAEGVPIGRPTARPERAPDAAAEPVRDAVAAFAPASDPASDPGAAERGAPTPVPPSPAPAPRAPLPARTEAVAPTPDASEDEPLQPPARRRPRLEFPDEF